MLSPPTPPQGFNGKLQKASPGETDHHSKAPPQKAGGEVAAEEMQGMQATGKPKMQKASAGDALGTQSSSN